MLFFLYRDVSIMFGLMKDNALLFKSTSFKSVGVASLNFPDCRISIICLFNQSLGHSLYSAFVLHLLTNHVINGSLISQKPIL